MAPAMPRKVTTCRLGAVLEIGHRFVGAPFGGHLGRASLGRWPPRHPRARRIPRRFRCYLGSSTGGLPIRGPAGHGAVVAGFGIVLVAVGLLAGCGTTATTGPSGGAEESSNPCADTSCGSNATDTSAPPTRPRVAKKKHPPESGIGTAETLSGNLAGEVYLVTVTGLVKSASETDQFEFLPGGQKLVAVELEIKDVGDVTEQDNVLSDTTLLDSQDEPYPGYNGSGYTVSQCHVFAGEEVTLSPGGSSSGCVIFQIPANATALEFNYQPDEGFGTLGQWKFEASPHSAKTIPLKTAANNFKNDEVPVRTALLNFAAATATWTDATTNAQAEADAQPLLSALGTFQKQTRATTVAKCRKLGHSLLGSPGRTPRGIIA